MAVNHTPGPWHIPWHTTRGPHIHVCAEDESIIAIVSESEDARLIAAAPSLYEAAREIFEFVDSGKTVHGDLEIVKKLWTAITLAENQDTIK